MTAGVTPRQGDLWRGTAALCGGRVGASRFGAAVPRGRPAVRRRAVRRPVAQVGRRSVPPRVVATVMVLQRLLGLSDREAVQAFSFDARWNYACGDRDRPAGHLDCLPRVLVLRYGR